MYRKEYQTNILQYINKSNNLKELNRKEKLANIHSFRIGIKKSFSSSSHFGDFWILSCH